MDNNRYDSKKGRIRNSNELIYKSNVMIQYYLSNNETEVLYLTFYLNDEES